VQLAGTDHFPLCSMSYRRRVKNAGCERMFQVFQRYVASVSYGCCKCNRSGCCICCNGYTPMLQAFVPNVSSVFSYVCCKCVYLDVAYVSHIYCKCFLWMLHMFCNGFSNVSMCFCKYFGCMFQVFHLSSDISKVDRMLHNAARVPMADGQPAWCALSSPLLSFPSLPFPSLHLAAAVQACWGNGGTQTASHAGGRRG
jgi:hypothetical protein